MLKRYILRTNLITLLLLLTFVLNATSQNSDRQINFKATTWADALKQASAQNKLIFVDAYATWCGPCTMLKATTFKNPKAAAFYNKNFVNTSLNMESGKNPYLAQEWGMRAYPTLIIFTPKGQIILNTVGYITAADLLRFGEEALRRYEAR
ncbi:thioredoxin domain-containing protein [Mucilaginibacter sp. CSA2-8R]|uniref:thioredoxin family protein n=1 Tax=Mucilaginibacter sp. CSA2-8R TaxID=3141542 RepID=UPI00315DD0E4